MIGRRYIFVSATCLYSVNFGILPCCISLTQFVNHYYFTLVNKTPNQPRCTLSLYRFKQEYKLEKELVPYRNLYIMLRHFKTPMSRVACEVMDEGTVVLYDFTPLFDFVREYHRAVCKGGCRECWVASDKPNNWLLRDH